MPVYLHQWNYKDGQIQRMLDDTEELDRADVIRTAVEAFGGTLRQFYWSFGDYDGLAISDFPDEATALACLMSIYGQGRITEVRTTPLFAAETGVQAIRYAQEVLGKRPAAGSDPDPAAS